MARSPSERITRVVGHLDVARGAVAARRREAPGGAVPEARCLGAGPSSGRGGMGWCMTMPIRAVRCVLVIAAMVLLPAAALRADTQPCPPGFERYAEYRMFFGRGKPGGGTVSDQEWSGFLAAEVTPRFPDGLTVVNAGGQWRDGKDAIGREGAKLLIVLAEPDANAVRRTEEIADAYKRAFDQQSVLRAIETVCAAF